MSTELMEQKKGALVDPKSVKGLEGFDPDLLIVPRLKIVQSMSEEANEPHSIRLGSLINNLSLEVLAQPKKPLKIIPLMLGKSRIKFIPVKDGGGIACMARDGKTGTGNPGGNCMACPFSQWTEEVDKNGNAVSVPPECTHLINIPVICPDTEDLAPLMLSFGKSSFKAGKLLANLIFQKRQSPWVFSYEISSKYVEDGEQKYYIPVIRAAGKTDEDIAAMCNDAYDLLQQGFQTYGEEMDGIAE